MEFSYVKSCGNIFHNKAESKIMAKIPSLLLPIQIGGINDKVQNN